MPKLKVFMVHPSIANLNLRSTPMKQRAVGRSSNSVVTERHLTTISSLNTSHGTVVIQHSCRAVRPTKKKASIRRDPRGSNSPKQGHGGVIGWVEQLHDKPLRAQLLILLMVFPPLFLVAPLSLVVFAGALVLFIAMYSVGKHLFLAYLLGRLL